MNLIILILLAGCHSYEDAQKFLDVKTEFENIWWESELYGVCGIIDTNENDMALDNGDVTWSYPYEFEEPNIYYVENYTALVYQNDHCFDIVISIFSETVCECPL
jgi:hypothetical protein